jgi:hypothetical protein
MLADKNEHIQDLRIQFDEGALWLLVDLMSKTYPVKTMQRILLLINNVTNAPEVRVGWFERESNHIACLPFFRCITVALMEHTTSFLCTYPLHILFISSSSLLFFFSPLIRLAGLIPSLTSNPNPNPYPYPYPNPNPNPNEPEPEPLTPNRNPKPLIPSP